MPERSIDYLGPHFLGIGMERAGTSWVNAQLAAHPDIWVPPLKELHFWDVIDCPLEEGGAKVYEPRYNFHLKARLKHKALPFLSKKHGRPELYLNSYLENLKWDARYFFGTQNEEWYQRLFDPVFTGGRLCGEVTPYYANMTPEMIARIEVMNPHMRYILMLRDPAQRAWSALIYHFVQIDKRRFEDISEDEMLQWLAGPLAQSRSDTQGILDKWQSAVPDERLFIDTFENIATQPEALIERLYSFLSVDSKFLPPEDLYKAKINKRTQPSYKMPEVVRVFLSETYKDAA